MSRAVTLSDVFVAARHDGVAHTQTVAKAARISDAQQALAALDAQMKRARGVEKAALKAARAIIAERVERGTLN